MSLYDDLAAVVARWREYQAPCPQDGPGHHLAVNCTDGCSGTSYVCPALVKALIEAVTQPCPCLSGCPDDCDKCCPRWPTKARTHDDDCEKCAGFDRTPRDWEEISEYALWGTLVGVANDYPILAEGLACHLQPDSPHRAFDKWVAQTRDAIHPGSLALADVNEALKQMYGGKP